MYVFLPKSEKEIMDSANTQSLAYLEGKATANYDIHGTPQPLMMFISLSQLHHS